MARVPRNDRHRSSALTSLTLPWSERSQFSKESDCQSGPSGSRLLVSSIVSIQIYAGTRHVDSRSIEISIGSRYNTGIVDLIDKRSLDPD